MPTGSSSATAATAGGPARSGSPAGSWGTNLNTTDPSDPRALAAEILGARAAARPLATPFTQRGGLTLAQAYEVQGHVTAARLARGERIVGWKLGYTSEAMRRQMGIASPNYGPLTDAMILADGDALPGTGLQPRVEPEIALRFARRLAGEVSVDEVLDACDGAFAALEVVDSVWEGYRFALEDNTADGSSAAWVVLGDELPRDDLASITVELAVDGAAAGSGTGADASGHPAAGVAWLARQIAGPDGAARAIEPGDLVITGGLTPAPYLLPGGCISARFVAGDLTVDVSVSRDSGQKTTSS